MLPVSGQMGGPVWKAALQDLVQVRTCTPQDSATSLPDRYSRGISTQDQRGHVHGTMHWSAICGSGRSGCQAQ